MKIKIRPDDTSMVQDDDWLQMDGWLAGLRDDGRPDPGFCATGPVVLLGPVHRCRQGCPGRRRARRRHRRCLGRQP